MRFETASAYDFATSSGMRTHPPGNSTRKWLRLVCVVPPALATTAVARAIAAAKAPTSAPLTRRPPARSLAWSDLARMPSSTRTPWPFSEVGPPRLYLLFPPPGGPRERPPDGPSGAFRAGLRIERQRRGDDARQVGDRRDPRGGAGPQIDPGPDAFPVRDPGAESHPERREVDPRGVARVPAREARRGAEELREAGGAPAAEVVERGGELDEPLQPRTTRALGLVPERLPV